jgi:regulator of sirC expression with transglutaminase-like and TPR domain
MTSLHDRTEPADRSGEHDERKRLLREIGAAAADGMLPLAEAALALAARDRPSADRLPYRRHLAALADDVGRTAGPARTLEERVAALNDVVFGKYDYRGDSATYDDLQNADLMRVIDRRRGLPVALGILYIHGGRAQGWRMSGLAFPGHFLVRIEHEGERAIIDPFNLGRRRSPSDLRELLKANSGKDAELAPAHYAPVGDRQVLLRLQNNIKLRLVQNRQLDKALSVVEDMLLFAPDHAELWREAGLLHAHLENYGAAIGALEEFLRRAGGVAQRQHAAALLRQLKDRLN